MAAALSREVTCRLCFFIGPTGVPEPVQLLLLLLWNRWQAGRGACQHTDEASWLCMVLTTVEVDRRCLLNCLNSMN
jgi:hypothetical protein